MRTIVECAEYMLEKYSTGREALEMANLHKCDYNKGQLNYQYWEDVQKVIKNILKTRRGNKNA